MSVSALHGNQSFIDLNIANELRAVVAGRIVLPSDEHYEEGRHVWSSAVPQRPAVIALCQNTSDVPLSVRGGDHHWAGYALRHQGIVIDRTRMPKVVVDAEILVATVGGGATVKDVDIAADAHGLVAALGNCGPVGIGGFNLGGGYGTLDGLHGLASDNLLGAEVVQADGRRVETNADREPELLWALRDGGGNFGVVTSLRIQLHRKHHMLAGMNVYQFSEARNVILRYAAFAAAAPDAFGTWVGMASGHDGQPALLLGPLWNGEEHPGEGVMRDLRALGTPIAVHIGPTTYSEMHAPVDAMVEKQSGDHWQLRTRWLPALTPGVIDRMIEATASRTSPHSMLFLDPLHGAATRIAPDSLSSYS